MDVLKLAGGFYAHFFAAKTDDDFSDRLNYRYTLALLMSAAVFVGIVQFSSDNIVCWLPAHFTSNYEDYVSRICWVQNTYYTRHNESISKNPAEKELGEIKYYQWVYFYLILQGFSFYLPHVVWTTLINKGGLYIGDLVSAASEYKSPKCKTSKKSYMNYLVKNIDQYVDDQRRHEDLRSQGKLARCLNCFFPCFGKYLGNYLVITYFFAKLFFIANSLLQIWISGLLLGQSFFMFGFNFIQGMLSEVTLCDFLIREIGNPQKSHQYTVQCVLPLNLFNQQIYTLIWFWFVFVAVSNFISLYVWIKKCFPKNGNIWITTRVDLFNEKVKKKEIPNRIKHFLDFYLEPDGIFMLRMIANNTSDYVATDLIQNLWCLHHEKYGYLFPDEPHHCKQPCQFDHVNPPVHFARRDHIYSRIEPEDRSIELVLNSYTNLELLSDQNQVEELQLKLRNRSNQSRHEYSIFERTEIR